MSEPHVTPLKCDRARWRTGGELKGKLSNAVGSHTLHATSEHGVSSITTADAAYLGCQQSTELTPPLADLNGLVRCAERRNLVSAHVPSHFKRSLPTVNQNRDGSTEFGEVTAPRRQQSEPVAARSAVLDWRRNVTTRTSKFLQFSTAQAPRLTHEKAAFDKLIVPWLV